VPAAAGAKKGSCMNVSPSMPVAGVPAEPLTVRVARRLQDVANFWPRTGRRGEAACYAFQCADVLEVWCDTLGRARGIEALFVTVCDGAGEPALLVPLGIERRHSVRILQFLDCTVSDYNAPVVLPAARNWDARMAQTIWQSVIAKLPPFDVAEFVKMPDRVEGCTNPLAGLRTAASAESCHIRTLSGAPFAPSSLPDYSDSRRRRRKLDKLGTVRFEIARDAEQRRRFLDAMMTMKRRRFIETVGYDLFTQPGYADFYRQATERLGESGPVQLSALLLNERILATHWGYVTGDRFYHLMPAHEAGAWRPFAPGRLLNEFLIEWATTQGLRHFDFCLGNEPYKFDYCDQHVALADAVIPVTPRGRLHVAMTRLRHAAKDALLETGLGQALKGVRNRLRRAWSTAAGEPTPGPGGSGTPDGAP
jgi:CelD/BcsL family acetyltransferase involved in cellulose biosynthesis